MIMQNNKINKAKQKFSTRCYQDLYTIKKVHGHKKELMSDAIDELNWKINQISVGEIIKVIYFERGNYILLSGIVSYIDLEYRKEIQISQKTIPIKDIMSIESLL